MAKDIKQEPEEEFEAWLHAKFTEKDRELWEHFVQMATAHQGGKSAFIRWLIDQEWARRNMTPHWVGAEGGTKQGKQS